MFALAFGVQSPQQNPQQPGQVTEAIRELERIGRDLTDSRFVDLLWTIGLTALVVVAVLGVIVFGALAFRGLVLRTVRPNERGIIERWGKIHRYVRGGLVFLRPWSDKLREMGLEVRTISVHEEVRTHPDENYFVKIKVSVLAQIRGGAEAIKSAGSTAQDPEVLQESVRAALYSAADVDEIIKDITRSYLRSQVASKKLDEIFREKDHIAQEVIDHLAGPLEAYGYIVHRALVTEIDPGEEVTAASKHVMAAQRKREAELVEADAYKQAVKTRADGDADASRAQGTGMANRFSELATGLLEAIRSMTGDQSFTMRPEGAVALIYQLERLGMQAKFAESGKTNAIVVPSAEQFDSAEVLNIVAGVTAADSTDLNQPTREGQSPEELQRQVNDAIAAATKDGKEQLAAGLKALRDQMANAISRFGQVASGNLRKVPVVGRRLADAVSDTAAHASSSLK